MNEVKKELIKMTGDMSKNKERVNQRVLQRHKVKPKKSISLKILTAIVTLFLVGFVIQFLDSDKKHQSAQLFNQTGLTYYLDIAERFSLDQGRELEEAYRRYEKRVASYYFALSLGIESTQEERKAEGLQRLEELKMLQESFPEYAEILKKQGLNKYFTKNIEPLLPLMVAEKKLEALYVKKYPTFPAEIVSDIATLDAIRYFNTHFADQAKAFQEEIGLENYTNIRQGNVHIGTVVAIQDNAFLLVEGAVPEEVVNMSQAQIIDKYQNATWYPLLDDISLQIGNYVAVQSIGGVTTDEEVPVNRFGFIETLEIIEPTVTTNLTLDNVDEVRAFLNPINWRMKEKTFDTPPNYAFKLDGVRVDIWEGYGHSLWLQAQEYGEIQLSQERAAQLKVLLKVE
ncbi:hypothetical protein ACIQXI_06915 [Lysinibacillus sp. NPDC097195]|uniref:hypothetical protein n=1 Tax=Lysinibacillus sp. NPDC097195 TaxID=3364141 RepID=UPI003814EFAF